MVREGYKKTEIGVIPEDWSVIALTEIGQSLIGLTYKPENIRDYGTLVLRSSNIQNDRLAYENNVYVDSALPLPSRVIVEVGDILICVRNGSRQLIGKCALIDSVVAGSAFGAFMSVFRTKISGFVFYQFQSDVIKKQINEIMGATINQITNRDMAAFQIALPPSEKEQYAIAQTLSDVDALIAAMDKLIAKKRAIKTGTMQQLLAGKKRLPGFAMEWNKCRLGDIVEKIVGGGTPSRSNPDFWGGKIPWTTVKDFATFNPFSTQEYITEEGLSKSASNLIPKGTLITSTRMALGKAIIYEIDVAINQDLKAIFPKLDVNNIYLYYWFQNNSEYLEILGSGSTVKGISLIDLKSIPFLKPSLEEQQAIAQVLSDMDTEITALETRRAKTQAIKQGMMQELLTGKTRLI